MRHKKKDLRVRRTKESIRNALTELIEEKGFEAITVKDITTRANINRGTFYIHYQDKYDLMAKCQEEIMTEMTQIMNKNLSSVISDFETKNTSTTPFTISVAIFEYISANSDFMKAILGPNGDLSFQTKMKVFIWKNLFKKNAKQLIKQEHLLVPGEYLVSYAASAYIGVIQQWLNRDMKESPQEMARILSTIAVNGPFFAAGLKK